MKYRTRRLRIAAGYLVSAALLVMTLLAVVTGIMADVWDLNDFIYHRWAGYAMAVAAVVHVFLYWNRLSRYFRRLFRGRSSRSRSGVNGTAGQSRPRNLVGVSSTRQDQSVGSRLSRRGFVGLALGLPGGWFARRRYEPPGLYPGSDVGEVYHQWSKPTLVSLIGTVTSWGQKPAMFKEYPGVDRVELPAPGSSRGLYTEDAIEQRRSGRDYSDEPLSLDEFSRLIFSTAGITGERGRRAAPSAGALYPIEVYVVVNMVDGVDPGLYHYDVRGHALNQLRSGDLRGEITRNGKMQGFLGEASVVFVFTAVFQRLRWKYKERTYRYALLEAGHLGQNVYLSATSMGLEACAVAAFLDDQLNSMLDVDGREEAAVHILSVGKV